MSLFWIVGTVVNVSLTLLAIWWIARNMRTRENPTLQEQETHAPPEMDQK